jgi:F-type H+-transporting ATPase subunit gamma
MAAIRQILQRKKAASNICRITKTMEMISTAKFKSYNRLHQAASDYHNALARAGYLMTTGEAALEHPLLAERTGERRAVLAVGSTRGLCGSYNSEVFKLLAVHLKMAQAVGKQLDIYLPESRLQNSLGHYGVTPKKVYTSLDEMPTYLQIEEIADDFIEQYIKGDLEELSMVYMHYHSTSSQQAQSLTILPLTDLIAQLATRSTPIWPWNLSFDDFYFSPPMYKSVEALAKMIVSAWISACFLDAALSEHFARMVAMRNATENADQMIKDLTMEYNRARQTQITGELLDIIGGTGALA